MLQIAIKKLPALLLALLTCFVTLAEPVRAMASVRESEPEIEDTQKAKEFCQQRQQSKRLRQRQVHYPVWRTPRVAELPTLLPLVTLHPTPLSVWYYISPPLRAPPA